MLTPVNEYKIQQAMSSLIRNRTVLVIAHHLQTIRNANQIIVMDKGQLVENGTHAELEAKRRSVLQTNCQCNNLINEKYGGMEFEPYLFFATSIHIDATSTQLSQTSNIHGFFGLLLSVHRCWCH